MSEHVYLPEDYDPSRFDYLVAEFGSEKVSIRTEERTIYLNGFRVPYTTVVVIKVEE